MGVQTREIIADTCQMNWNHLAVKVAKEIFKKAYRDKKDPWLGLLDQRNTPRQGVNSSPA